MNTWSRIHYNRFTNEFIIGRNSNDLTTFNIISEQDFFGNVTLSSFVDINLLFAKKEDEKISFIGSKARLTYITEKNQVYFKFSKKESIISSDFDKDQKNMVNFVKNNINAKKKCYKIFEKNIF